MEKIAETVFIYRGVPVYIIFRRAYLVSYFPWDNAALAANHSFVVVAP